MAHDAVLEVVRVAAAPRKVAQRRFLRKAAQQQLRKVTRPTPLRIATESGVRRATRRVHKLQPVRVRATTFGAGAAGSPRRCPGV